MLRALLLIAIIGFTSLVHADNPSIFIVGDTHNTYTGTAFVLQTKKGIVGITNAHVCGNESVLVAKLRTRVRILVVRAVYDKSDLCIIAPPYGVPPLKLADAYREGEYVHVEGFPLGLHGVSRGRLGPYSHSTFISGAIIVQYYGHIDHGNSGSPMMNDMGEVIGVITSVAEVNGHKIGGAVPLEYLKDFVDNNPNIW